MNQSPTYEEEMRVHAWCALADSKQRHRHPERIDVANERFSDFTVWADRVGISYFVDISEGMLALVRPLGTVPIPIRFRQKSDAVAAKLAFGGSV